MLRSLTKRLAILPLCALIGSYNSASLQASHLSSEESNSLTYSSSISTPSPHQTPTSGINEIKRLVGIYKHISLNQETHSRSLSANAARLVSKPSHESHEEKAHSPQANLREKLSHLEERITKKVSKLYTNCKEKWTNLKEDLQDFIEATEHSDSSSSLISIKIKIG